MHNLHDIRRRIRSIGGTAQITKAMQMVAASKMRKAQESVRAGRAFARLLYRIQREATARSIDFRHPLLELRTVRKRAVILIGADKGLCGALNNNLFRVVSQFDPESTVFVTAGRKASQFIARTRRQLVAEFAYGDEPTFLEAQAIASLARDLFLKREVDQVRIVGTEFLNTLMQRPVDLEYLPIGEIKGLKIPGEESEEKLPPDTRESLFEPGPEALLAYLLSHYLNIYMHHVLLNAKASEQSARMVSMKNASDNAHHLIQHLTLEYNNLRQGNITKELLEIAGGQSD